MRSGRPEPRRAGAGNLLRLAVDRAHAWRGSVSARSAASTAAMQLDVVERFGAFRRIAGAVRNLEQPRGSCAGTAAGFRVTGRNRQRDFRGGGSGAADLCGAISSRSAAHGSRNGNSAQFRF